MTKPSIFISYSSKDRKQAEAIHQHLESSHFEVWRDQTRLETDWSREIAEALAQCNLLCLIWSENAAQSKWVKHEWLTARALEKYIIVCWLPGASDLPEPLQNLHAVKFDHFKDGLNKLVERLNGQQGFKVKYEYHILPPNSFIPFNPNPEFTGRENDLLELYLKMIGNLNKIGINQVGTVGMGGIGKTQLVVEFAYRYSFAFSSVHWIQAVNSNEWVSEFVKLAKRDLQLEIANPESSDAHEQYIFALRNHFKAHPNSLVVMDNVEEPELLNNDTHLFGLTPLTLGCDLLFTTQSQFNIPGVTSQPINILSKEAAYFLLESYRMPSSQDEKEHAEAILNAVGYLPLAIILIGAYLREYSSDISFADYHEELKKNKLDTIDIGEISSESLATRHIAAVTKTLESQWKMLQNEHAKYLFKLAGQLAEADIIPKARLTLLASKDSSMTMMQQLRVKVFKQLYNLTARLGIFEGTVKSESNLSKPLATAFNHLHKLNLMERLEDHDRAIRLHPLIHNFARALVKEHKQTSFKARAAKNLKQSYFQYTRLENELLNRGVHEVINDLQVAIDWLSKASQQQSELVLLQGALRLSSNQLIKDNNQLTSQLLGRLQNQKLYGIKTLLKQAVKVKQGPWFRPCTASLTFPGVLLRTLEGHTFVVNSVVIHPDGNRAISASADKTLKVWDLETGTVNQTLEGHWNGVCAVAIHPDGRRVVSASWDRTLKIWDLEIGVVIQTIEIHEVEVNAVAFTPDGKWMVSGSKISQIKVFDLETGTVIQTMQAKGFGINSVAIHPDGRRVVSASWDEALNVWDLETGTVIQTLEGHRDEVLAVAIHPDGRRVVSASKDKALKLWNLENGELLTSFIGENSMLSCAIEPISNMIVAGDEFGRVHFLRIEGMDKV